MEIRLPFFILRSLDGVFICRIKSITLDKHSVTQHLVNTIPHPNSYKVFQFLFLASNFLSCCRLYKNFFNIFIECYNGTVYLCGSELNHPIFQITANIYMVSRLHIHILIDDKLCIFCRMTIDVKKSFFLFIYQVPSNLVDRLSYIYKMLPIKA